jgi:hypothetical protein
MVRQRAALLLSLLLCACGGGGGGSSSPGSDVRAAAVTAIPDFTRGFAQFTGTPTATAAGDVDGDGADDVVVLTSDRLGTGAGSEQLYVFYQRSNGPLVKFAPTSPAGATDKSLSTAVCDVDGDGRKEILVGYAQGELGIYKPAADGTPVLWRTLAGARSASISCADLDGDGLSDVVTTGKPGVTMQVFLQRNGSLVEQASYPANGVAVGSLDIGDVDGDGKADIVFFGRPGASGATELYAHLQTSAGQFAPAVVLNFPRDEFGDVFANRLAVAADRKVIASLSGTKLVAGAQSLQTSGAAGDIRVRDLNGDGRADIAVVHAGMLGVYYQNADGTFTAEQPLYTYPSDPWIGAPVIAFGDFDSDGKLDVAVASQTALLLFFQE